MSLQRNTLWNLFGAGLPFLVGIVSIPYLIGQIGVESFGILSLIWVLIGYFSLFDFGLGRALTQQIATNRAAKQNALLPNLVKTGLLFVLVTGLLGAVLLFSLAYPLGIKWLNVSAHLQQSTINSLLIAAIGIPLTTITTGLKGILEAYEDFKAVNLLRILLGVANFGFPVLTAICFGASLPLMVLSLVIARLLILFGHLHVASNILPEGWFRANFDKENLQRLLSFGVWMTVSNIVSPLMVIADRFIISAVLGANIVAYYTVPSDLLIRILIIPAALSVALFPRLTSLITTNRKDAKLMYIKCMKYVALLMFPICLSIAIFSNFGLTLWLGEDFAQNSWLIASILSIGIFFNSVAHISFAAIQAAGKAKLTAIIHLGEAIFYLPLLFVFLHYFSLPGAAIVWVIRVGVDLVLLSYYARKVLLPNLDLKYVKECPV